MSKIIKITSVIIVLLVLVGCGAKNNITIGKDIDLEDYFSTYNGVFKLYDISNDSYLTYNEEKFSELDSPASTFKILHSLIALETGVLNHVDSIKEWNGTNYSIKEWNKDHTLRTAVEYSVIWYFQEVAREIGREKMQYYLDKTEYGNRKIGANVDEFWLDGSLTISADDQLDFITNLYKEQLPFSKGNIKIVKDMLIDDTSESMTLAGKTGTFEMKGKPNNRIGWYIGYITNNKKTYTFVTKIEGESVAGWKAKDVTEQILRDLDLYKQ